MHWPIHGMHDTLASEQKTAIIQEIRVSACFQFDLSISWLWLRRSLSGLHDFAYNIAYVTCCLQMSGH